MSFSLNEIEAMGKRAARGAGLSFGLAEEAGKAARWLEAHGYPGAERLAAMLTRDDKRDYAELAPTGTGGVWRAPAGLLCPLITGVALSDRAAEIALGREIELDATAQPLLLAPYAAGAAKLTGVAISLAWDDVAITLTPGVLAIKGNADTLMTKNTDSVHCRRADDPPPPAPPAPSSRKTGFDVDATAWKQLTTFAERTLAPATETSRLSGAGPSDSN